MPWTMGAFAIGALSMIGAPPFAGFISKWYLFGGALQTEQWIAVGAIVISTLLNAAYFMPIVYAAFFLDEDPGHRHVEHGEAPLPIVLALVATALFTILLFFFPGVPLTLVQQMAGGG
jgi:multicomponent Na+:H+ antiporter subunit D